jgi:hypothetical protein
MNVVKNAMKNDYQNVIIESLRNENL